MLRFKLVVLTIILMLTGCTSTSQEIEQYTQEEKAISTKDNKVNKEELSNINDQDITSTKKEIEIEEVKETDSYDTYYFKKYERLKGNLGDFILEAYDKDGNLLWSKEWNDLNMTELDLSSDLAVQGEKIYIGVYGTLYAIDGSNGKEIWKVENVGNISQPYINKDKIYVTGFYGPFLTCIDINNGGLIWQYQNNDMHHPFRISKISNNIVVEYEDIDESKLAFFTEDGSLESTITGNLPEITIQWDKVTASSILDSDFERYGTSNIIDKNIETAWVEGIDGYGIEEWIKLERDSNIKINRVQILNGYHKTIDIYEKNGKVKKLKLEFSDNEYMIYDIKENTQNTFFSKVNIILAKPINTRFIKFTILDAYEGRKYEDTCISEIITK